jgi:hypothetical protein
MDITKIDPVSYATRVGHMAAGEIYGLLAETSATPALEAWYRAGDAGGLETAAIAEQVLHMGLYVATNQVDQGERLWRWAVSKAYVPAGDWPVLGFASRQAFEVFVDTARHVYLGLATAQQAADAARRAAGTAPAPLALEDSIFEREEALGTLRPEAVAAGPLMARYARERQLADAEEKAKAAAAAAAAEQEAAEEAARRAAREARPKRVPKPKPAPLSAGDTLVAPAANKGGRGNKKAPPAT